LAHPQGYGFSPSELMEMTVDEILWWWENLQQINHALKKNS
jgi:hypothetical protein